MSINELVLEILQKTNWPKENYPVYMESFEIESLVTLKRLALSILPIPMQYVYLIDAASFRTYYNLVNQSMEQLFLNMKSKQIIDGFGLDKGIFLDSNYNAKELVTLAHQNNLYIHIWTLRQQLIFFNTSRFSSFQNEVEYMYQLGIDGAFTDDADVVINILKNLKPYDSTMNSNLDPGLISIIVFICFAIVGFAVFFLHRRILFLFRFPSR